MSHERVPLDAQQREHPERMQEGTHQRLLEPPAGVEPRQPGENDRNDGQSHHQVIGFRLRHQDDQQYEGQDVPDPYYGGSEDFEKALDLIEQGSQSLLKILLKKKGMMGCGC